MATPCLRLAVDSFSELRENRRMPSYEIECPMCESTEYETKADGMHECYICNTSWGSQGRKKQVTQQSDFAKKVNEKLRRYSKQ